jgi:hypothetical protein
MSIATEGINSEPIKPPVTPRGAASQKPTVATPRASIATTTPRAMGTPREGGQGGTQFFMKLLQND